MALVRIPERQQTIDGYEAVSSFLATYGITYERWEAKRSVPADATADMVLQTYGDKIDELKARGGYTTADVVDVTPTTPNLDAMLAKFSIEHWHDEDEVRFIVEGRGLFHVHPPDGPVFAIEVQAGDLISVPRGTHPLVRSLLRSPDPRDSTLSGRLRLDAALHRQRRRRPLPADLLRSFVCLGRGVADIDLGGVQSSVTVRLSALHTRALLLDIEGTTTPIAFVYEILFPYARAHAAAYLARNQDSAACRAAVALLRREELQRRT